MNDKLLGIIGGMGPEATARFYEKLIENTKAKKDQDHFKVLIYSNPKIPDRTKSILENGESPVPEIIKTGKILEEMGAEILGIPCVTSHFYFKNIQKGLKAEVLNILDVLNEYIHLTTPKIKKIGILSTTGTKKTKLFEKHLKDYEIIYTDSNIQSDYIMRAIYDEDIGIKSGKKEGESKSLLLKAAENLKAKGAEIIILGCTEIGLSISQKDLNIKVLDPLDTLAMKMTGKF